MIFFENRRPQTRSLKKLMALSVFILYTHMFINSLLQLFLFTLNIDVEVKNILNIVINLASYCLVIFIALHFYKLNFKGFIIQLKERPCFPMFCFFFSVFGICCSLILTLGIELIGDIFNYKFLNLEVRVPNSFLSYVILIFNLVVLPAFFQGLLFRGIIFNVFKSEGISFAAFMSSFLFCTLNVTFVQIFYNFVLGIFLVIILKKSNSLLLSIFTHMFCNFILVSIEIIRAMGVMSTKIMCNIIVLTVFIGTISLILLSRNKENFFKILKYKIRFLWSKENFPRFSFNFSVLVLIVYNTSAIWISQKAVNYNMISNNTYTYYKQQISDNEEKITISGSGKFGSTLELYSYTFLDDKLKSLEAIFVFTRSIIALDNSIKIKEYYNDKISEVKLYNSIVKSIFSEEYIKGSCAALSKENLCKLIEEKTFFL